MDYFRDIQGQDEAVSQLNQGLTGANINHAYLFMGPPGVGKMPAALAFARGILNLSDDDADRYWGENVHPDLFLLEKKDNRSGIGKEQITKELEPWLSFKPYRSRHRVAVIRDGQTMTPEAANALLKTLEEPAPSAVIILLADENSLLETIISRCRIIKFSALSERHIVDFLLKEDVAPEQARQAAVMGQGSLAYALVCVQAENLGEKINSVTESIQAMNGKNQSQVFKLAEYLDKEPELFGLILGTVLRDMCVYLRTGNAELLAEPGCAGLMDQCLGLNFENLMTAVKQIYQLKRYYRRNINSYILSLNMSWAVYEGVSPDNRN